MDSDSRQNWHTYEVDWQPDYINWSIDGNVVRTLKRDDTYNETTNQHMYPQTPSRVQLSLWPGGLPSNGEGTIEWAGGLVDWDSKYMSNGYYFAQVKNINVECYDPPHGDKSGNSYYYSSTTGTEDTVVIGDNSTVIGSLEATGDDPDIGKPSPSESKSSATSKSTATKKPESVPGMSGGGNAGNSGGSSSGGGDSGSSGDTAGSANDNAATRGDSSTSFDQGMDNGSGGSTSQANHVVAGSAVALLGFFVAALML